MRHARGQGQGIPASSSRHTGRARRANGVDEINEFSAQGLFGTHVESAAFYRRATVLDDQAIHLGFLRGKIHRDIRLRLKHSHFPHTVSTDSAGCEIRNAPAVEAQAYIGNIEAWREHVDANGFNRQDIARDERLQQIEIVDHQVEDDVDVEAPIRERAEPMNFDKSGLPYMRRRGLPRGIEPLRVPTRDHHAA